jgi:hypothetical protein
MRYLYGDSAPFPHPFNFLATLEAFMGAAGRIVSLESESRSLQIGTASTAAERVKSLDELETFHEAVMRAIQDSAARATTQQTQEYARQVIEHAGRMVDDAKRTVQMANDRDQGSVRAEVERRRHEIRQALEAFLLAGRLPALDWSVTMHFTEGHNVMSGLFTNPEGIVSAFQLATNRVPAWQVPRKVGEFAHGMNLMVGLKKSFFSKSVQPEMVPVDDFLVTGFDLTERACELRLRKKLQERDVLVFSMRREEGGMFAEVSHPQEEGSEAMPSPVDPGDLAHLGRLWDALKARVDDLLDQKERLISLKLEGEDVFENDLAIMLIERLIRFMAPTVTEIAKRSPNPAELSLKVENDNGRREEIYVKKDELLSKIMLLGEKERSLFTPLGLVPGSGGSGPLPDDINFDEWDN